MRPARLLTAILLAAALGAAGCSATAPSNPWRNFGDKHQNEPTLELATVGPIGIDIELFNGTVKMECDPKLENTRVTLTRRASHGWGRGGEAKASLDDIATSAQIVPGTLGPTLQIRASTTNAEPHFQAVDVEIKTAAIENVYVRTSNGWVFARGVSGELDIESSDGDILVLTAEPLTQPIAMRTDRGDIDLRMRSESRGVLRTEALRGEVLQKIHFGTFRVYEGTDDDTLLGTLNNGTNPIDLRAIDGDVRVMVVRDPEQIGAVVVW